MNEKQIIEKTLADNPDKNLGQIGKLLGLSRSSLYNRINELGIKANRAVGRKKKDVGEVGKSVFDEKKINEQLKKVTKQESKKISTQQETKTIEVPKGGLADLLKNIDINEK